VPRSPRSAAEQEGGAAVVDFVLVSLVLVPLVLGVIQVGLTLYVRNTLVAAATEGARHAATLGSSPEAGAGRARAQLDGVLSDRFVREVSARYGARSGLPVVEVRIRAVVPALGLWGPGVALDVTGHGVRELDP
jgi:hypothetical protein